MSLAEKEHIWRVCKKWVNDDISEEEVSSEEEEIPAPVVVKLEK
jgi:hypothetical protein